MVKRSEESLQKRREYNKEYYRKNKKRVEEYREKNIEHIKKKREEWYEEKGREYYAKVRKLKMERLLFHSAKSRAKEFGVPFEITVEDIIIPEFCPYLKIRLTRESGKGQQWSSPSLDRIIPELGYVKGNIRVISRLANTMKSKASIKELIQFAKSVLELHGNSDSMGGTETTSDQFIQCTTS